MATAVPDFGQLAQSIELTSLAREFAIGKCNKMAYKLEHTPSQRDIFGQ